MDQQPFIKPGEVSEHNLCSVDVDIEKNEKSFIKVRGASEHNLRNVNVDIPKNKLVVVTGLSGSGKSSLAFDTIYAEGQRKYVESLSAYARQFLHMQNKPKVESISGLSPAIAIDQKTTFKTPRSTVGTITEIYDYLRLLYARIGTPYSPTTGLPIRRQTVSEMVDTIMQLPTGSNIYILAPIIRGKKGEFHNEFKNLEHRGFERVILDGILYKISEIENIEKNKKHTVEVVVSRVSVENDLGNSLADSLEVSLKLANGISYVQIVSMPDNHNSEYKIGQRIVFSEKYACPESGFALEEIEPRIFSFNSPFGACSKCEGLGKESFFDENLIIPDESLSIKDGAIVAWSELSKSLLDRLQSIADHYNFELTVPIGKLPQKVRNILLYGSGEEKIEFKYKDNYQTKIIKQPFAGIIPSLEERLRGSESQNIRTEFEKLQSKHNCSECNGYRLKHESLSVKIDQLHIGEVNNKTVQQLFEWCSVIEPKLTEQQLIIAKDVLKEISNRLKFLIDVGLNYLNLSRESFTLSGGESQRIRLASQIGSGLTGVLYVLDEPSIGLHQRDNEKLISTLKNLRNLGNTVLVVEHDEDTMLASDHIIDVGPGAGVDGGNIVAEGTFDEIANNPKSITGLYLSGRKFIAVPKIRRTGIEGKELLLKGADSYNLHNLDITIKLGTFTAVTGVSGSGKSTLIIHTLYKAMLDKLEPRSKHYPGKYETISGIDYIDKVIDINQSPIGRTPRSNPATYTGLFNHIRDWFAELPDSKMRGYKGGRFSFNVKGGRCEICQGDGLIKIEMHFLPDVYVHCDACKGKRYNRETLEIKYKDKSISDILEMTVKDLLPFFSNIPIIYEKLVTLKAVGLDYIKIGQSATTLSGGEAQRVKLAKELSKHSTGKTFYILDEPTTGLHIDDIKQLLNVLHQLVDKGNTVVVIEHNMEVIKTADYIIDVGPEGGDKGGYILDIATPEIIAENPRSHTGFYLKRYVGTSSACIR